ncbi:BREX-3 system P-loop-containing protein BrxF [Pelotomaculum isophthalicicum JI]|uniref:BREX-3 system P-loop-containing protein BrxF n=1 Tax=Pelotomaculum isophthalicicum JI TaxID=947010 RepID=A0A9X4JTD4_9FIRM|nr:BREX-3 system P-loop-containing protein BrxF [Pelotomaculum isophthalicicum]MDF9408589.1 BREX-3 system P-loop-containing protein BrxF [Pelotomaculum isophthalicicum JI]
MSDNSGYTIKKELEQIRYRRHQLLIICGVNRTKIIQDITRELAIPRINLSLKLSEELLEVPVARRSRKVSQLVDKLVSESTGEILCFEHIELLFHPLLQQDPMRILENISRNKIILVSWNGHYANGRLTYAEPEHPEYRAYNELEASVFAID